jgi:Flp pilus assembly protein TadD
MKKGSHVHPRHGPKPVEREEFGVARIASPANPAQLTVAFRQAAALHQAGRLADAEQIYNQILKAQPRHFESHFLLGVIYSQRAITPTRYINSISL